MRGTELLLGYFLVKVVVCDAEGETDKNADEFIMVTRFNQSAQVEKAQAETPHTEEMCRGYHDVMGQWDAPFVCRTGSYLYCCGTCGFRFCCEFKSSRLDQNTCMNYDTPPWMTTAPTAKGDRSLESAEDKTSLIVYIVCGIVAIMALIGIFTKLGLEKTHRPHRENMSRALAQVIRHPADRADVIGLGQHYESMEAGLMLNSFHSTQMNNVTQSPTLISQPYPAVGQITSPYEQLTPLKDLNTYATLKAVEKANDSYQTLRQQANKSNLPMEADELEPELMNPYSPPRQHSVKQERHKSRNPRSYSSTQSLYYSSSSAAAAGALRPWQSKDTLGHRQSYVPKKLSTIETELHDTRFMPPQPYFVTNSKTEVTV